MPEPTDRVAEILEAALQREFEHAPYTFLGLREPEEFGYFEPLAAAAFFEAPTKDGGKWGAYRGFMPHELEIDPSFIAACVREEIDAFYNRDFN